MKLIPALALLSIVAACRNTASDYQAPEQPLPEAWSRGEIAGGELQVELEAWWIALRSPTLERLIDRALEQNIDLATARARVREARANAALSRSAGRPQVDVGAAASRNLDSTNSRGGSFFGDRRYETYDAGFDAGWELDVFGRIANEVAAARAEVDARGDELRGARTSLIAELARNYVEWCGLGRRLEVTRASIDLQQQTADIVEARAQAGMVSDLDLTRARAEVDISRAQIPALEAELAARIHRMGVLLGLEPRALASELAQIEPVPAVDATLALGQPIDLLRRRPDVRAAERRAAALDASVESAIAQRYPKLSLGASFGWLSIDADSLFDENSQQGSIGPSLTLPLFDGGRIEANVERTRAQLEHAELAYRETILGALAEVEDALAGLVAESRRSQDLARGLASQARAAELARELYSSGLTDFLTVIDAERARFRAEDELAQSETQRAARFIALAKSLGGGWDARVAVAPDAQARAGE